MENLPLDVITNNLYKNNAFAICIDPKDLIENYHYTIWFYKKLKILLKLQKIL